MIFSEDCTLRIGDELHKKPGGGSKKKRRSGRSGVFRDQGLSTAPALNQ
jgi:hypothetical protein